MRESPPLPIGLQEPSGGASAATFSTQEVIAITAIAITASRAPPITSNFAPNPARRRWRRRMRCVIAQSVRARGRP